MKHLETEIGIELFDKLDTAVTQLQDDKITVKEYDRTFTDVINELMPSASDEIITTINTAYFQVRRHYAEHIQGGNK